MRSATYPLGSPWLKTEFPKNLGKGREGKPASPSALEELTDFLDKGFIMGVS